MSLLQRRFWSGIGSYTQNVAFHVKRGFSESGDVSAQLTAWGVELSRERVSLLLNLASLLAGYREANVIGTKTKEEILEDHVLDSLSCLMFKEIGNSETLVDVGSGGGLPGLPLKIAVDGLQASLIEATSKKTHFLRHAIEQLGVTNIHVVNQRVEEVGINPELREKFDIATARALSSLDVLAEYCLPLVKVGGNVVAMKGRVEDEELRRGSYAANLIGGEVSKVIEVKKLPHLEQKQRHLVIFTKKSETPAKYPRRVGIPTKKPLGAISNA